MRFQYASAACVALCLASPSTPSLAQGKLDYGSRPIRLVVPVAAGGGTDTVARIVAAGLETTGLRSVIDNRGGAGGVIGTETVARASPDGYTLLFAYASHTTAPFLAKVPYDADRDFFPVTQVGVSPLLLLVNPALPVANVKELIALAKSKPRGLNVGIATAGSAGHLSAELFKLRTGTSDSIVSVIYKGGAAVQIALLSNEVQLFFASAITAVPYVKSGKVRSLATSARQRLASFPEVPTLGELGIAIDAATPWQGMLAPAKTPNAIVMQLYEEVAKVLKRPDIIERLAAAGTDPVGSTPAEFRAKIKRELDEFGKLIPTLKLKGVS
ncbi:MAG: tripartite tricarboxylate transporter substrate binding protein [Burkholderiales bacterium]|nr:tripartite tricarboxylate transporter substrate binding protein [Burkholderiales bacterium]